MHWHRLPHCTDVFAVFVLESLTLSCWYLPACTRHRIRHCPCTCVVVLCSLIAIHTASNLIIACGVSLHWLCFCVWPGCCTWRCCCHLRHSTQICHAPYRHCGWPWLEQCLTSRHHIHLWWHSPFPHCCHTLHLCHSGVVDARHQLVSCFCIAWCNGNGSLLSKVPASMSMMSAHIAVVPSIVTTPAFAAKSQKDAIIHNVVGDLILVRIGMHGCLCCHRPIVSHVCPIVFQ